MSLVNELKREVLDPQVPVSTLLRKALIAAKERNDRENAEWIEMELKGYPDNKDVPEYRKITGRPIVRNHYTGWQYVYTQNLTPELAHKISTFHFGAPMTELEANAAQEHTATTYHPKAEQMLVEALGGGPAIPAVLYYAQQFQNVLDTVRQKLLDWVTPLPDEQGAAEEGAVPQVVEAQTNAPQYRPAGLSGYFSENKSWLFQGIGTEVVKWIGGGLLLSMTFLGGYFWAKQPPTQQTHAPNPTTSPTPTPSPMQGSSPVENVKESSKTPLKKAK